MWMLSVEIQTTTLLRSLAIAVVLVAPYGAVKWRQVRARRRAEAEAAAPEVVEVVDERPRLEDVIDAIGELGSSPPGTTTTLLVPTGSTVDGAEVAPAVVDALVRDALARSGLVATAEVDTAEGRRLECVRPGD